MFPVTVDVRDPLIEGDAKHSPILRILKGIQTRG
jgi:hypothetical protein